MAKEPKQLEELFHDTLKDIYFAEKRRTNILVSEASNKLIRAEQLTEEEVEKLRCDAQERDRKRASERQPHSERAA